MKKTFLIILINSLLLINLSYAQENCDELKSQNSLTGKQSISISLGLLNQVSTEANLLNSNVKTGFLGALHYNYWLTNNWAVELNTGMLNAEVQQGITFAEIKQSAASVFPVLVGARYYPNTFAIGSKIRPYTSIMIGAFIGVSSSENVGYGVVVSTETKNQTTFGTRIGAGIDVFINSWLRVGLNTGYNLLMDFDHPVGVRKNFSGLELSASFGLMF